MNGDKIKTDSNKQIDKTIENIKEEIKKTKELLEEDSP